jgi:ATP-dependent Clp protease ATP-binding subunit ClpX
LYFHRGQSAAFQATLAQEEEKWENELRSREDKDSATGHGAASFEEYRKAGAAGF